MPRPKKENLARLTIRLREAEKRAFLIAAAQAGMTVSDYLLARIHANTPTVIHGDFVPAPREAQVAPPK